MKTKQNPQLKGYLNKQVTLNLRNGTILKGKLLSYDPLGNLSIEVTEADKTVMHVVRGAAIETIYPA